jgi:hypothetical protein
MREDAEARDATCHEIGEHEWRCVFEFDDPRRNGGGTYVWREDRTSTAMLSAHGGSAEQP